MLGYNLQVKKCADAGADIVRITVQGKKEAEACMKIREQLFKDRCVQQGRAILTSTHRIRCAVFMVEPRY